MFRLCRHWHKVLLLPPVQRKQSKPESRVLCFAQYQVKLPEGFTAKEILGASDNANFYFENGKVLYQWYKLPIDRSDIELRFTVTAGEKVAAGKYQLPGYFSYQFNNRLGQADTGLTVEVK